MSLPGDPRLLEALDVLLREQSVSRAAARLGVGQPAMSHALKRLREHFGDALLVRAGRANVLTPRGEQLRGPVHEALRAIARVFDAGATFDPATSDRAFRIVTTDGVAALLLPAMLRLAAAEAPRVRFTLQPFDRRGVLDPMAAGDLDLAVTHFRRLPGALRHQRLFDERYVALVREGHPLAGGRCAVRELAAWPHLLVAPRGAASSNVERALAAAGVRRRVLLEVPHFLLVPETLGASDAVAVVSSRLAARWVARGAGVRSLAISPALPPYPISQVWHERAQGDAAHAWLRRLVKRAADAPDDVEPSPRRRRPAA